MKLLIATILLLLATTAYAQNNFVYGTALEDCSNGQQLAGTNGLVIVPDNNGNLQNAINNNNNKTILVRTGNFNIPDFNPGANNIITPFGNANGNCNVVTIQIANANPQNFTQNGWIMGGFRIDCLNNKGGDACLNFNGTDNAELRNNFIFNGDTAVSFQAGSNNNHIHGNIIEGVQGNNGIRDLVKCGTLNNQGATNTLFERNWVRLHPNNTARGNDTFSIQNCGAGYVITNNLVTGMRNVEQYVDIKQNQAGAETEISFNTWIGPGTGQASGNGERMIAITIGDTEGCKPNCPTHNIHHNYFKDSWHDDPTPSGNVGALAIRFGTTRFGSANISHNIDDNARNTAPYNIVMEVFDRVVFSHNSHLQGAFELQNEACLNNANLTYDKNSLHQTRIFDDCNPALDWTITNNVFSGVLGGGFDAGNIDGGNANAAIVYASIVDGAEDFTITTVAHSQKGALPVPTINSANIGDGCVLNILMTPFNGGGFNHGPMSAFNGGLLTVRYDGAGPQTITNTAINPNTNTLLATMQACPAEAATVTFDAAYGWCQDSANIGGRETAMNARCLAVAGQAVTNNVVDDEQPPPPPQDVWFVDVACETNGDGTGETCGANGPWNTLEAAIVTAQCSNMEPGNILQVAGGTYQETENLVPDAGCTGITIQNEANETVIFDGTVDISGETWVAIGNGVFECTSGGCGVPTDFPVAAWYEIAGGGEQILNLIQSVQTCTNTLAAGFMRYDPINARVCAHLADDSSPANADYFVIPSKEAWIRNQGGTVDSITIRKNPLGGAFFVQRFRERGFTGNLQENQGMVIDGLDIGWMMDRCISFTAGPSDAALTVRNSNIHHCGVAGIRADGDIGTGTISGNHISEIQTSPTFELCNGVGDGCIGTLFESPGAGIAILNRDGQGYTITGNTVTDVGGGHSGVGIGIYLRDWTSNNVVEKNYVADITGSGIKMSGIRANEDQHNNLIKNNKIFNVTACFEESFAPPFTNEGNSNSILNNTCANPTGFGVLVSDTTDTPGDMTVENNIFMADTGSPVLVSVTAPAGGWDIWNNNAFECDTCTANVDIISVGGFTVERAEDCTSTADCIADWNASSGTIDANIYGDIQVDTTVE